ncbi:hypothetical protein PCANC_20669 [Puccinia coronata f. sp. avenae]|uniref:Uncharacterized protein n=1 Tax=Puccinia coronata f. sp. avenae TaxID=200324 RepID=A0A2N5UPZ0_9BASI|nr:hypothetical protein PCANC_20669 [Puccinia coronata f. sp. avenae]
MDGPLYNGPFWRIKPFLKWLKATQIFFAAKSVTHDEDKICIVGSLIQETNTITWYENGTDELTKITWIDFQQHLITYVLPLLWHTTLRHNLHNLALTQGEPFASYSTRA